MADSELPHYLKHRQRLRERFLKTGLAGFADHEVVELLLTLCIPRRDVKERAKVLLARFGTLRGILVVRPINDVNCGLLCYSVISIQGGGYGTTSYTDHTHTR